MSRLAALAVALLVACSGQSAPEPVGAVTVAVEPGPAKAAATEAPLAPRPRAAPEPLPPPPEAADRIELTFVGDIIFGGQFKGMWFPMDVPKNDPLAHAAPLFASDLVVANLETTVLGRISEKAGHRRFFATPDQVATLQNHGINTVSIANNHINDAGAKGLSETVRNLDELGFNVLGPPRDGDPFRVQTMDVKGWKLAFIAATARLNERQRRGELPRVPFAFDEKLPRVLLPLIEAAQMSHDLVFVVVHWGNEYADTPKKWQVDAAHAFIDAGADAVIGHHPHVLQPIERYKAGIIAYSLGNFLFQNVRETVRDTGVLRLGFSRGGRCLDLAAFHPAVMKREPFFHPMPVSGEDATDVAERLTKLSARKPHTTAWTQEGDRLVTAPQCPRPGKDG